MKQYEVNGMTCAACVARVEKAVGKVPGVTGCAVNLLTSSMGVEGSASPEAVIAAVTKAGYEARLKEAESSAASTAAEEPLADRETPLLKRRLCASLFFLALLMYLSMGQMLLGLPLPAALEGNPAGLGILQLLLSGIVLVINQHFFISGFTGLLHGSPNMDALVALGSFASFFWSVLVLLSLTTAQLAGDAAAVRACLGDFYFESAAMIVTLITVGKLLEARSKGRTTDALRSLLQLAPQTAVVVRDGTELTVPVAQVRQGDIFLVRPGSSIPVDGIVLEGSSAVNEAALTGESLPVDKAPGDSVAAATLNQSGFLRCEATRVGSDTTLAQIIRLVSDAAATKAPIAKLADTVSGVFVPVVITLAVITTAVWLLLGQDFAFSLARGIAVLVISCPCALGLATPVAIMVGNGTGARHGILFKTAASLEEAGKCTIIALDKTGTLTTGQPDVTDIIPAPAATREELLQAALALEARSEHPLARAVMAEQGSLAVAPVEDFQALPGNGLTAVLNGARLRGGSMSYISSQLAVPPSLLQQAEELAAAGKTPLLFAREGELLGIIAVADTLKPDSPVAVRRLQEMGLRVVMLTGDNERTAQAIGRQAGVDQVIAGVLPDGKESVIRSLQEQGKVIMVGDGINDAPALTRADIGIAIGAGADVAIDAADVVLLHSRLSDVPAALQLSRATLHNIKQNLFWAFFYNIIGIPLAAGCLVPLGLTLSPMFGAAAMSLSSFCVITNALRLNLLKLQEEVPAPQAAAGSQPAGAAASQEHASVGTPKAAPENPPAPAPEKAPAPVGEGAAARQPAAGQHILQVKISGMMCGHCEMAVKRALKKLPGVTEATASFSSGLAELICEDKLEEEAVTRAIEAKGYTVLSLERK